MIAMGKAADPPRFGVFEARVEMSLYRFDSKKERNRDIPRPTNVGERGLFSTESRKRRPSYRFRLHTSSKPALFPGSKKWPKE
jgi:hypothetical protein